MRLQLHVDLFDNQLTYFLSYIYQSQLNRKLNKKG